MEQRMGIRLPPRRSLWNCGRGASLANAVQSNIFSGGKSRCLRTLARSQLGLDRWIGDLPFSLQHWPANLHLWTSLSRSEVKEPRLVNGDTNQHTNLSYRFCTPFVARELLAR